MSADFQLQFRKNNNNLHVQLRGTFDGNSACELFNLLEKQHSGQGNIFIDTKALGDVIPFGRTLFQSRFHKGRIPIQQVFFKGEKGFDLAPDGSRVLVVPPKKKEHVCCGKCANCSCRHQGHHEHNHEPSHKDQHDH